ncbi:MAG TPA: PIN domain-containing protein [Blastocatellia bacterium]|nr:PIN domain-containing protein [Blastocatellia bacterium]
MIVISDTNILSSLAAGDSIAMLRLLYKQPRLIIPPTVQKELQSGFERGKTYLQAVLQAIANQQIEVVSLSAEEELQTFLYPVHLDAGEREAIALAQSRKALLLSNDGDAIRYCKQHRLLVVSLINLLRLFWIKGVLSQDEVRDLIVRMEQVETLTLTPKALAKIFAPDEA